MHSENVWNPSDCFRSLFSYPDPQKPDGADDSRTQTHRTQTARPVNRLAWMKIVRKARAEHKVNLQFYQFTGHMRDVGAPVCLFET